MISLQMQRREVKQSQRLRVAQSFSINNEHKFSTPILPSSFFLLPSSLFLLPSSKQ